MSPVTDTHHGVLSRPMCLSQQIVGSLKRLCLIHLCALSVCARQDRQRQ